MQRERTRIEAGVAWLPDVLDLGLGAPLIGRSATGLAVLADDGLTVLMNAPFLDLFGVPAPLPGPVGRHCAQWTSRAPYDQAGALWSETGDRRHTVRLTGGRTLQGRWEPFDAGAAGPAGMRLLTLTNVTAEVGIQQQLRAHNRALAELVATKTELVTSLLHQLRTPMTSLAAAAGCMPDPADADDPEVVRMLQRSTERLRHVVDEISELSALENGTAPMAYADVDLPAVVRDTVHAWQHRLPAGLTLTATVPDGPPAHGDPVHGDPAHLATLVDRMIAVSVATADPGTALTVDVAPEGGRWLIRLPLPASASSDRLFTSVGGRDNATALGFVRAILARHDGRLRIVSHGDRPELVAELPPDVDRLLG